ncbi:MAG: reverse transcriptase-like protein [Thermoplasmata archaeon]
MGLAWQITVRGESRPIRTLASRTGKGPNYAEMAAVGRGIEEARRLGIRRLLVRTDNQFSAKVLLEIEKPSAAYMVEVCTPVLEAARTFEALAVIHTRTKNIKELDRAARRVAQSEAACVSESDQRRIDKVAAKMREATSVSLERDEQGYIADGYIRVVLAPPSCTCRGWTLRWRGVPLEGKRAQRLPCIHLISVAMHEGKTNPAEIAYMGRLAVE